MKESNFARLKNVSMEYCLSGADNKETILFVHGLGVDLRQFEGQHAFFKDKYRVLSVSLRGHGKTEPLLEVSQDSFKLSLLAKDLIELLNYLKIEKVHYVGNSMGGNVGYEWIQKNEQGLLSFTTFGTTAKLTTSAFTFRLMRFTYNLISMKTFAKLSGTAANTPQAKSHISKMISEGSKPTIMNLLSHLKTFDYLDVIRKSSLPVLIIKGDKDKEINREIGSTIEAFEARGNFQLANLKNTGHFANLDCPQVFNTALLEFISHINPGGSKRLKQRRPG